MAASGLLEDLIDALRCLPGVGPKSAQRMALHLLQRDRESASRLGQTLLDAMSRVQHCQDCRIFTEQPLCRWCVPIPRAYRHKFVLLKTRRMCWRSIVQPIIKVGIFCCWATCHRSMALDPKIWVLIFWKKDLPAAALMNSPWRQTRLLKGKPLHAISVKWRRDIRYRYYRLHAVYRLAANWNLLMAVPYQSPSRNALR